jgi:hypothetical protein
VAGRRLSSKDLLTLKTAKNEQLDW